MILINNQTRFYSSPNFLFKNSIEIFLHNYEEDHQKICKFCSVYPVASTHRLPTHPRIIASKPGRAKWEFIVFS